MIPTSQQNQIIVKSSLGNNLIVLAVAGSGKTKTIELASKSVPHSLFLAYNKATAEELATRGLQASTFHSLCFKGMGKRRKVNSHKMSNILRYKVMGLEDNADKEQLRAYYDCQRYFSTMSSLIKGEGIFDEKTISDDLIQGIADHHQIDRERNDLVTLREMFSHNHDGTVIDFDDMLEADAGLTIYPTVFVDEAQDLNKAQRNILHKIARKVVCVGDPRQAIYGFRGASPDSMDQLEADFMCESLPLTTCFRCSKAVIREAQTLQPEIEPMDEAVTGLVDVISSSQLLSKVSSGDFILCRTTAPLVSLFFTLISKGVACHVAGKDLAEQLEPIIRTIQSKYGWTYSGIEAFLDSSLLKLKDRKYEQIRMQERIEIVHIIYQACIGKDPIDELRRMFSTTGIRLSTIHRAKGLEADKVFLIRPDLLPHPAASTDWELVQENNLKYVAITRARKEFYYVN